MDLLTKKIYVIEKLLQLIGSYDFLDSRVHYGWLSCDILLYFFDSIIMCDS